jgi:dihydropteroate synthase
MTARHYLRPTGFVDAPFGHDGKVARLAGGLGWFSAVEILSQDGDGAVSGELVGVSEMEGALERLGAGARAAWANLTAPRAALQLGERIIRLDQPQVVGMVDAAADGEAAADAGFAMAAAGAAIVEVGGESVRAGAKPVWEGDETALVVPVVTRLAGSGNAVSIGTRKAAVMEAALGAGAAMVNDVSALTWDERAAAAVAQAGCPVVLLHHEETPDSDGPVLLAVYDWLEARIAAAAAAGIDRSKIIVDPGIGSGKTVRHNLHLLNGLSLLHGLGCAVMVGASRKRMIGALAGEAAAQARLPGSLALALKAMEQGVQLLRVHDVPETVQALKVWRGLRDAALAG